MASTSLKMQSAYGGKKKTRTINYVNPETSESDLAVTLITLNSLTDNEIVDSCRVEKTSLNELVAQVSPVKQPQVLTLSEDHVEIEFESTTALITVNRLGEGVVTITADDEDAAAALNILKETANIFLVGQTGIYRGETTLTVTVAESAEYESATAKIYVTLTAPPQSPNLSVDVESLTLAYEDTDSAIINASRLGDGEVTMTISHHGNAVSMTKLTDTSFSIRQTRVARDNVTLTLTVAATEDYTSATVTIPATLTAAPQPQNLTVDDDDITIEYNGSAVPLVFGRSGSGEITLIANGYTESISINKTNDTTFVVSQTGIVRSSTTLTATVAATEEYQSATATINVTLTAAPQPQNLTLSPTTLAFTFGDSPATIAVSKLGTGAVTMTSDNTDVTVTKVSDAEFTVEQITNASGTATLTATVAQTTEYQSATATATVTLTAAKQPQTLTLTPSSVDFNRTGAASTTVTASRFGNGEITLDPDSVVDRNGDTVSCTKTNDTTFLIEDNRYGVKFTCTKTSDTTFLINHAGTVTTAINPDINAVFTVAETAEYESATAIFILGFRGTPGGDIVL